MCNVSREDRTPTEKPEVAIARLIREDLGVDVNPQALRMFVRSRWKEISRNAHLIEGGR